MSLSLSGEGNWQDRFIQQPLISIPTKAGTIQDQLAAGARSDFPQS